MLISGKHFQNAYVTRDAEAAVERLRATADVRFHVINDFNDMETWTPEGMTSMSMRLALVWVDDMQYEFVQPLAYSSLFSPALPEGNGLVHHHTAVRVEDWDSFAEEVKKSPFPIVMKGEIGDCKYMYLDTRDMLGHVMEFAYLPDAMWAQIGGR
ncbi:MAG TPA: VOC family protein [Novosphingobium sp.]|nr:VOC family protein [Novosphingobium sp.]